MKKNKLIVFMVTCMTVMSSLVYASTDVEKKPTPTAPAEVTNTEVYFSLEQDVFLPKDMKKDKKYPVVFFAHNGGTDKSGWGDFPEQVSKEGFLAVNITWKDWDTCNVEAAIGYTLQKYAANIDTNNVVFIGGCHGSKDLLQIMSKEKLGYTVKTAVILSLSEDDQPVIDTQKLKHSPILVYYSKNDVLGEYYQDVTKKIAQQIITTPKKVIELNESAHGNDILTQATCKDEVRANIIKWIKEYTK